MADDTRQTRMTIDLGDEQLELETARCVEALGRPFTLVVDVLAALGEVDLLPHMGKPVAVHAYRDDELMRHFHGLITGGELLRESKAGLHYRLVAQPFTYFLSQNRDMAIFQDLSVPDIIGKVLTDAGQTDFELKLARTYAPRVYCVQYRESDFQFLTRLMEEEGIYYFFEHQADKHRLILCDAPTAHQTGQPATLTFNPFIEGVAFEGATEREGIRDHVSAWTERVSSSAQKTVTLRAFNLEKPEQPIQGQKVEANKHPLDEQEIYDYAGRFVDEARGAALSAVRLGSVRYGRQVYAGRSQAVSLACGTKLTIREHPAGRLNQTYLVTRTEHVTANEAFMAEDDGADHQDQTHVLIEAIVADAPFHMPQVTPKPVVQGLETAIVSGPAGEEIYTDDYGRVKVRFHWDRADTAGENSSCWMRVAQFGNLGSVILPRVNQEVVVDFLGGDPDNPIVMGWVFNKGIMPIYDLPANKTRAVWRTRRYGETGQYPNAKALDTGAPGANELRFEDKGGKEEVFLHAERDMNTRIRFEETHHVGASQDIDIGYNRTDAVGNDETTTIGARQTLTVKGDQQEMLKANRTIDVANDDKLHTGQSLTIEVGTDLKIKAGSSITIECGSNSITFDLTQIAIKALQAQVSATMTSVEGTGQIDLKGGLANLTGDAMTAIKGGLVNIN